jgi:integrase
MHYLIRDIGGTQWWQKEAKLVDFHWHDLRHTFASRCIMAGVDLRTLQQLLGHKTLQMVVRYTHLSQSHELAAVERLCETKEATGTTTGTTHEVPADAYRQMIN